MGGRLPLTMRGAPIGSWGSAGTRKTRALGRPVSRSWALPQTPCREPSSALSRSCSLTPGSAEKLSFCQYVSRLGHPGRRLCTNRGAADEPKRGSARL